jgi:ribosomal protein S1
VGDEVPVYVLGVDRDRERISLSRKRLLPDPWPTIAESLSIGQIVEGEVTSVAEFGIFVDVGQGVEGLVHTSEIPPGGEVAPEDLKPRARVAVEVLNVDQWRQRIALSLKDIAEDAQGSEVIETSTDAVSTSWTAPEGR